MEAGGQQFIDFMDLPEMDDDENFNTRTAYDDRRTLLTTASVAAGGLWYSRKDLSQVSRMDDFASSVVSSMSNQNDNSSVVSGTAALYPEMLAIRRNNNNHVNPLYTESSVSNGHTTAATNNNNKTANCFVRNAECSDTANGKNNKRPKSSSKKTSLSPTQSYSSCRTKKNDDTTDSTCSVTDDISLSNVVERHQHHKHNKHHRKKVYSLQVQSQNKSSNLSSGTNKNSSNRSVSSTNSSSYRTGTFSSQGYRNNMKAIGAQKDQDDDYSMITGRGSDNLGISQHQQNQQDLKSFASSNCCANGVVEIRTEEHPLEEMNKVQAEYIEELESRVAEYSFECATLRAQLDTLNLKIRQANTAIEQKNELIADWEKRYNTQQRNLHEVQKDMLGLQTQQQEQAKEKNINLERNLKNSNNSSNKNSSNKDQSLNVWQKITVGFRNDSNHNSDDNNIDGSNENINQEQQQSVGKEKTLPHTSVRPKIEIHDEYEDNEEKGDADMYTSLSTLLTQVNIDNNNDEHHTLEESKPNNGVMNLKPIQWFQRNALNQHPSADAKIENKLKSFSDLDFTQTESQQADETETRRKWFSSFSGNKQNLNVDASTNMQSAYW